MVFKGADAVGFEEDARLTAMWLWTLSTGNGNGNRKSDGGTEVRASTGYMLEYDAARKIAQGLGAHLEQLDSIVEVKGDKARLLSVSDRTRHLFGKDEVRTPSKRKKKVEQPKLFNVLDENLGKEGPYGFGEGPFGSTPFGGGGDKSPNTPKVGPTMLDKVHQAMILFAAGRAEAVKRFLVEEGVGRDSRFWTLAQALAALYPSGSVERRWVEGVLARKKSLGF